MAPRVRISENSQAEVAAEQLTNTIPAIRMKLRFHWTFMAVTWRDLLAAKMALILQRFSFAGDEFTPRDA